MKPEIYREIMTDYSRKQAAAARLSSQREAEVTAKIPRIAEINSKLLSFNINLAKALVSADPNLRAAETSALKEKTKALLKEKDRLLSEAGYPADYIENVYECPLCHDTGFVENDFCSCFKAAAREKMYEDSSMKSENDSETFGTFSLDYYSDEINPKLKTSNRRYMENIFSFCKAYAKNPSENLLFTGFPGLGKSFLCHAIAKARLDKGFDVVCESAFTLFDKLIKNRFGKETDEDYKTGVFDCSLLIIDDLGAENINAATNTELFNIINYRLINKKPLIISTNLSLDDIKASYSERISSRIIGSFKIIPFFGSDIRILKKKQG